MFNIKIINTFLNYWSVLSNFFTGLKKIITIVKKLFQQSDKKFSKATNCNPEGSGLQSKQRKLQFGQREIPAFIVMYFVFAYVLLANANLFMNFRHYDFAYFSPLSIDLYTHGIFMPNNISLLCCFFSLNRYLCIGAKQRFLQGLQRFCFLKPNIYICKVNKSFTYEQFGFWHYSI